jgi:hypothetical protein
MSRGKRIVRSATSGAALFVAGLYVNNGGFAPRPRWAAYWSDVWDLSAPVSISPMQAALVAAVLGTGFGVGYTTVARRPRHPLLAGAVYGAGVWAAMEGVAHSAPRYPGGLAFRPPARAGTRFIAFGMCLAWITDRR